MGATTTFENNSVSIWPRDWARGSPGDPLIHLVLSYVKHRFRGKAAQRWWRYGAVPDSTCSCSSGKSPSHCPRLLRKVRGYYPTNSRDNNNNIIIINLWAEANYRRVPQSQVKLRRTSFRGQNHIPQSGSVHGQRFIGSGRGLLDLANVFMINCYARLCP